MILVDARVCDDFSFLLFFRVNEVAKVRRDHLVHLEGQVFLVALDSLDLREIEDHRSAETQLATCSYVTRL